MALTILIKIHYIESNSLTAEVVYWGKWEHTQLRTQTRNIDFVKTVFTARMSFTVIWYSVLNNSLPSNNRIRYQGNIKKGSCIWERIRMCNILALIFLITRHAIEIPVGGSTFPCNLSVCTRWKWRGYNSHTSLFIPGARAPMLLSTGGWMRLRTSLNVMAKTKIPAPVGNRTWLSISITSHFTDSLLL